MAQLYEKTNTDVKTAIKLITEEAKWFKSYPRENIVVSANENRVPLILDQPLVAAFIPEGGKERIMQTPAPTSGTFLPIQSNTRHGFTGLAQALGNRARAGMIEDQLTYQANMSGYSLARSVGLSTYGTSVGTQAVVKTTGSGSATQVIPLKNAYGSSTFCAGGDAGVQDTYLSAIFRKNERIALIRSGSLVEFGTVTASPSATSGIGYIDVTFTSSITPTVGDLIVFAMADTDITITGTDYNNAPIGFTDYYTASSLLGVTTANYQFWQAGSAVSTPQRLSFAVKERMKNECWTAGGMMPNRFILPYGVRRDAISGELGGRRYDGPDVDIEGDLKPGNGDQYFTSPLAIPNTLLGFNADAYRKIELSDLPEDGASKGIFKLDKVQGVSAVAAGYDYFYQRIPSNRGAGGYATQLTSS